MLDWQREPGVGRFVQVERERRFLLSGTPPAGLSQRLIEDRYLEGLRLRLRRVTGADGPPVHKLTQKVRALADDPSTVALTTMYLSADEWASLRVLPGAELSKRRSLVGDGWVVDRFLGPVAGLVLAEIEVEDLSADLVLPAWVGREVTAEDRWSGGALARVHPGEVTALLTSARDGGLRGG